MAKNLGFSLREPDTCVKCAEEMPIGTEVSWLRDPGCKGFFHTECRDLPAQPHLVLIQKQDPTSPTGYVWARAGGSPLPPRTQPKAIMALHDPNVVSTAPAVTQAPAQGVLEALAQAIMPYLKVQVAAQVDAALAKVTVRVHREGA